MLLELVDLRRVVVDAARDLVSRQPADLRSTVGMVVGRQHGRESVSIRAGGLRLGSRCGSAAGSVWHWAAGGRRERGRGGGWLADLAVTVHGLLLDLACVVRENATAGHCACPEKSPEGYR